MKKRMEVPEVNDSSLAVDADDKVPHLKALMVMRLAGDELLEDPEEWQEVPPADHLLTRLGQVGLKGEGGLR